MPLALLGRPRIDVTLRVSGLFRDVFPALPSCSKPGPKRWPSATGRRRGNPYRHALRASSARVPGTTALAWPRMLDTFTPEARRRRGRSLARRLVLGHRHGRRRAAPDRTGIEARVRRADAFVHVQDLPETDLLLAADYAAHEAGFAAAAAQLGGRAATLYHLDATRPGTPRARTLTEEIARVVRARAANPDWIAGMMAHGFRGAAEIAATLEHMAAFAHLASVGAGAPVRPLS